MCDMAMAHSPARSGNQERADHHSMQDVCRMTLFGVGPIWAKTIVRWMIFYAFVSNLQGIITKLHAALSLTGFIYLFIYLAGKLTVVSDHTGNSPFFGKRLWLPAQGKMAEKKEVIDLLVNIERSI